MLNKANALETAKMLLGIEGDCRDNLLSFLIEDNINLILNYCRISDFPSRTKQAVLKFPVLPSRLKRATRRASYGQEKADKVVKSETQGSVSKSYEDSTANDSHFLNNYRERLKPFINRKGRVPSDFDEPEKND